MSKFFIFICFLVFSFWVSPIFNPVFAGTCNIESTTLVKGKLYSVTGSDLGANRTYYIYFGNRAVLLINNTTDNNGNLNAQLDAVAGSDWFQPGSYQTEIRVNNFEKCALGTITLQNPTNTEGYKYDKASNSCPSCTIGSEAACTFSDLASCQKYINVSKPIPGSGTTGKACESGDKSCAAGKLCPNGQPGILTAIGCVPTEPADFVKGFLTLSVGAGGGIAFLIMLFGAFRMITSAGNPENLKAGQEQFSSAIIGLLFVIFSVLLLKIIGVDLLGFGQYLGY